MTPLEVPAVPTCVFYGSDASCMSMLPLNVVVSESKINVIAGSKVLLQPCSSHDLNLDSLSSVLECSEN